MSEIADEFKIVVVDAIRAMCLKFPQKHRVLMSFLSNVLREEGGFPYKKAIVDTILVIIAKVPEAKEAGLGHLCEFIEDCEFTLLSTQILYLLGLEGPGTQDPSKYIRFIYNRVVLENATVRASAVSALAKFGLQLDYLRESIIVLLQRCLHDNDDEVRDRATFFVAMLQGLAANGTGIGGLDAKTMLQPLSVPLEALETSAKAYMQNASDEPFSLSNVTVDPEMLKKAQQQATAAQRESLGGGLGVEEPPSSPSRGAAAAARQQDQEADLLSKLPQFVHVGQRFSSSKKVALSETGTEYEVSCLKHVFANHILLQFQLNNTLEDQLLEDVTVSLDLTGCPGLTLDSELKCPSLPFGSPADCFVCLRRTEGVPVGTLPATLKFLVKDVDPANGGVPDEGETGYDDEYNLEELEIVAADFVKKVAVVDFKEAWSTIGADHEVIETFSLSYPSLKQAMDAVTDYLGLQPCDNTGAIPAEGARTHTVLLSGLFLGGVQVFAIVNLRVDSPKAVGMRLMVRSTEIGISQFVASSVASRMPPCSSDADEFADEREATLQALAECNNGRHFGHKHEMFMHGKLMSGPLPKPTVLWKSDKKPRKDHDTESWLTATEYEDVPAAMKAKVKQIAKLMRLSRHTVAYTGAGISASAVGQAALSGVNKTGWLAKTEAQPTPTHHALARLGQVGLIHGWVQQNHDGLPQKAGFPQEKINEVHGSWFDPSNPVVKYSGSLKEAEAEWMERETVEADLVLVLGTSLGGLYADQVATECAERAANGRSLGAVIINLQQTEQDGKMSVNSFGRSDDVLRLLLPELGIEAPPTSARALHAALPQWSPIECALVPYNASGARLPPDTPQEKWMWLDLRPGARIKLNRNHNHQGARQPNTIHIGAKEGKKFQGKELKNCGPGNGVVVRRDEETASIKIQIESTPMRIGIWWLMAAVRGGPASLPIVNDKPKYGDAPDPSGGVIKGKHANKGATPSAAAGGKSKVEPPKGTGRGQVAAAARWQQSELAAKAAQAIGVGRGKGKEPAALGHPVSVVRALYSGLDFE